MIIRRWLSRWKHNRVMKKIGFLRDRLGVRDVTPAEWVDGWDRIVEVHESEIRRAYAVPPFVIGDRRACPDCGETLVETPSREFMVCPECEWSNES